MTSNISKRPQRKKKKKKIKKQDLKKFSIVLLISIFSFLIFKTIIFFLSSEKVLGVAVKLNSAQIIALVNQERQKEGLSALKPNEELARAAQAKISDMFVYEYWDHLSPSGKTPWPFILDAGYDYAFAGENLAKDFNNDQALVKSWMESDSHRANILSPDYEDTAVIFGSGQINGQETILIVQFFGKQYTDQDYLDAGVEPPRQISTLSTPLINRQSILANTFSYLLLSFVDFKLLAFFIIGFLLGFILFELLSKKRQSNKNIMTLEKLKKKYWGKI
jgi:uncharacterized protein YkwD